MDVLIAILLILLIFVCLAMIGLILIQRGKGGGLSGVFGGGGVEQAFGTHAATMAQKATALMGILFLVLTIVLGILMGGGATHGTAVAGPEEGAAQTSTGVDESAGQTGEMPAAPTPGTSPENAE